MQIEANELYRKLVDEYKIINESGTINFSLKNLTVEIKTKDSIGNLLQEWLKYWMDHEQIDYISKTNTQTFPDFNLNIENTKKGLLEVKSFDLNRGPGFDLANFDSYCNSLLEHAYRIDSDYLIFAYEMKDSRITIKNVWLKKIWELSCPSSTYPVKVQEKKNVIYNIRPSIWYSERATYKPFNRKEEFLSALNETRYQYPQTRHANAHWLQKVIKNYEFHTGTVLAVN